MSLPPELWDHVLGLNAVDCLASLSSDPAIGRREQLMPFYDSMRSYALICRASSEAAQRLLFQEIALLPTIILGQYWGSVDESPAHALSDLDETLRSMQARESKALFAVRILDLAAGNTSSHAYGSFTTVVQVILRCPAVSELRLSIGDLETNHSLSPRDVEALSIIPSLRRLTITGACPSPLSREESEHRAALPLSSLVRATAASLEHISVTNMHGLVWEAINSVAFPRLTFARVLSCGPPSASQEVLTLRLPEHAPALHTLHVQPGKYQCVVGSPSLLCSIRDIHVTMARGTFNPERFRAPVRLVLQWSPLSTYLGIWQSQSINASLRVIEFTDLEDVPTWVVRETLAYWVGSCAGLPRLVLLLIHLGRRAHGDEIPPEVLAGFSCNVRVEMDSGVWPFEDVMKIVEELERK
ncbi:hypothetical protein AURDEDRAFT_149159 [Auricularia subglabra TFB-10046 SS5]|nr:hypothetical protein AURDEDRAFT_149159 [Auricularia subglabra TFB-10046 SS5]